METHIQGNIIAKTNNLKIPKSGVKFTDDKGRETGLSLFRSVNDDTLFLGFNKNSSLPEKDIIIVSDILNANDKTSINDMLKISRQISLKLGKNLLVHEDIASSFDIMNFVSLNNLMIPMTQNEIISLKENTGNQAIVDVSKMREKFSQSAYINKKEVNHRFRSILIPDNADIKFTNDFQVNEDEDVPFRIKMYKKNNNDYSHIECDLKHMNNISISVSSSDSIKPPKMPESCSIRISNEEASYTIPNKNIFYDLVDKNINFKYHLGFSINFRHNDFDEYVKASLKRFVKKEYFVKRVSDCVSLIDFMGSKDIKMEDAFSGFNEHHDFKFISTHIDEARNFLKENGVYNDKPVLSM